MPIQMTSKDYWTLRNATGLTPREHLINVAVTTIMANNIADPSDVTVNAVLEDVLPTDAVGLIARSWWSQADGNVRKRLGNDVRRQLVARGHVPAAHDEAEQIDESDDE